MANTDAGVVAIRSFAQLSEWYQRAVMMKSRGVRHEDIALMLRQEFGRNCSQNTVNQWFSVGGLLEQALSEYNEQIARESLKQADLLIKRAALPAAATLARLLSDPNPYIQLRAAESILKKVFPKGIQISETHTPEDEELPQELVDLAERILVSAT